MHSRVIQIVVGMRQGLVVRRSPIRSAVSILIIEELADHLILMHLLD